ncbi:MAG: hypothetical protein K2Z81_26525 [Cyanobacteria bacterium]|nr:hypothetical protein [Cyanobacteriota bacterium]
MTNQPKTRELTIVELLIRGDVVPLDAMEDAMKLSDSTGVPLVEILQKHNYTTERQVEAAFEVRNRYMDGQITAEMAYRAIRMVTRDGLSWEAALATVNPKMTITGMAAADPRETGLAELLMASGAASRRQVETAFKASNETGLAIGRILIYKGVVTRADLKSAFAAHRLINEHVVEKEKVIHALKLSRLRSISIQQALSEQLAEKKDLEDSLGPGEYMVMAGAIPESYLLTAKEIQLLGNNSLELVLVELGYTTEHTIEGVKEVIKRIDDGALADDEACRVIQELQKAENKEAVDEIVERIDYDMSSFEPEDAPLEISDILIKSGLLSKEELDSATEMALERRQSLIDCMFDEELIDEEVMEHASYLKTYLDHNLLKQEQAIIVLAYCLENKLSVEETLDAFGW